MSAPDEFEAAGLDRGVCPLHPDVQRVFESVVEALVMLESGVYLPYGAPADHAGGCSEAEAHQACADVLSDVATLLRLDSAARRSR